MKNNPLPSNETQPALFIGIDWADREHETYTLDEKGHGTKQTVQHSPEAIDAWITDKLHQAQGKPVAIILEQTRGALIHALMFRENVILYPVNPKQFANYRQSYSNAGCKDDATDAKLLARMLVERRTQMRPWRPDDESTRTLARLCETRRKMVDEYKRLVSQLTSQLKAYFPLILELNVGRSLSPLTLELVRRWPDPRQLKRADRRTLHIVLKQHRCANQESRQEIIDRIRAAKLLSGDRALIEPAAIVAHALAKQIPLLQQAIDQLEQQIEIEMNRHPDAALFTALPGAGKALAPRLLTAFGSDRDRFANADQVSTLNGIAPVTKQSGKSRVVHRRYACSKFLRQTFHEFSDHARKWCPWSRAYYRQQRDRGMKHHAALRKLATRWIRILFRVWKNRVPYDPQRYLRQLRAKNPAIIPYLEISAKS